MSYVYREHRPFTLTDEGQRKTADVLDFARRALELSGAVQAGKLLAAAGSGDSWQLMACVERLVELEYLAPLPCNAGLAWQSGVFVAGRRLR